MIVNSKITIYHKELDELLRLEKWKRYNYDKVWLFANEGANANQGYNNSDRVSVRIWYKLNENLDIKNISKGDIIVEGHLTQDIETQQDLSNYEIYNVTSITNNTYGNNRHIHLGGQ